VKSFNVKREISPSLSKTRQVQISHSPISQSKSSARDHRIVVSSLSTQTQKDRRENRNSDKNWPLLSATNLVLLSLSLLSDNLQHTQTLFISPCPAKGEKREERERETYPLDDLGLFNEESANDSVSDAVGATRSTVSTLNSLLSLGDLSVFTGSESGNLQNQSRLCYQYFFGFWKVGEEQLENLHREERCGSHRTWGQRRTS